MKDFLEKYSPPLSEVYDWIVWHIELWAIIFLVAGFLQLFGLLIGKKVCFMVIVVEAFLCVLVGLTIDGFLNTFGLMRRNPPLRYGIAWITAASLFGNVLAVLLIG